MKKISLLLIIFVGIILLSGCKKEVTEPFSIICEGIDNSVEGLKSTNKSVYNFDKDQYVTDYEISMTSVYDNEEMYNIYKEGAVETANSNDDSVFKYNIKTDDETKTVYFSYKVTLTKEMYEDVDDKDYYKASEVLKRAETNPNAKCTFKGINKNQLK